MSFIPRISGKSAGTNKKTFIGTTLYLIAVKIVILERIGMKLYPTSGF